MVDLEHFSDLIGAIYDCVLDDSRWQGVMRLVVEFCGGHGGMIAVANPFTGAIIHSAWYGIDLDRQRQLIDDGYGAINPVAYAPCFVEVGGIGTLQGSMPRQDWLRSKFFREWAGPQRFIDAICLVTAKNAVQYGMTLILFDHDATEDNVEALRLMGPHLLRALNISQLMRADARATRDLSAMIDALPTAAFLLDAAATVLRANPAGEQLLAAAALLRRDGSRLAATAAAANQVIRAALHQIGSGGTPTEGISVPLGEASAAPVALLMPLPAAKGVLADSGDGAIAALFVQPPQSPVQLPPELLARRYRLTPAELRIFIWIANGHRVAAIADFSGTSQNTVKTHLRALFAKTGARRQADLVRLALSTIPVAAELTQK